MKMLSTGEVDCVYRMFIKICLISFTFASPKTTYVSETRFLNTSGLLMTNNMFFDFRIVTRLIPKICLSPSWEMA